MVNPKDRALDVISLLVTILSLLVPIIAFIISAPSNIKNQSLIIFGIMIISIILFSIVYFIYQKYRNVIGDLENSKKEIFEIRKSLNYKKLFDDMNIRLKVLEKLTERRRGQLDPRIIWIIIMLILLYLFLKSFGILP